MNATAPCSVSVVIPAPNGWDDTFRCLLAVARSGGGAETVVVDDGTTDETRAALPMLDGLTVLRSDVPRGVAAACNAGASAARGEVVVFLDRGTQVAPGFIGTVAAPFADPAVTAALPSSASGAAGAWLAVRAEAFRGAGGLDPARPDPAGAFVEKLLEAGRGVRLLDAAGAARAPRRAPAAPPPGVAPPEELTRATKELAAGFTALRDEAWHLARRFPADRDVRFLLAEASRAAGLEEAALQEYETLLRDCPPNERQRVEQGLAQCRADRGYFPPVFAQRLSTAEYAVGHNAERWRDYAWKEIKRGREIVGTIRRLTPLRGKRVLDVGSGYGGMLISMAEQGARAMGVEIDRERAEMSKQRLAALGMEIPVHEADICEEATRARLGGAFDVVVCQDVLEHVLDPGAVIRGLSRLLVPGGVIYVQIPNKWGIDQLLSDHHYGLTGITALSRRQAIEYWTHATREDPRHYGVGFERGERYYLSAFARAGVKLEHVQRNASLHHVAHFAEAMSGIVDRLKQAIHPGLHPRLEARIRRRMSMAVLLYKRAYDRLSAVDEKTPGHAEACDMVVRRLCLGLWRFLGVKQGGA
jgi:2-polyprenyl-3-methyl-5-hydroxy-6-metoxy-1,4-benzoquinol methylase